MEKATSPHHDTMQSQLMNTGKEEERVGGKNRQLISCINSYPDKPSTAIEAIDGDYVNLHEILTGSCTYRHAWLPMRITSKTSLLTPFGL